jgi:hypothetical protein
VQPGRALNLLKPARRIATIKVFDIAVVALLATFAHAIAARTAQRQRAIGLTTVTIAGIAVVAFFARLDFVIAASNHRANAVLAYRTQPARFASGHGIAARVLHGVAGCPDARVEVRAVARGVIDGATEFARVASVAVNLITVVAFFGHVDECVAADVIQAAASNADFACAAS